MAASALAFAAMTACGHALHDYCDWRITTVARASIVLVFSVLIALRHRVRLVVFAPPTLWMRSLVGSGAMLLTFYAMDRLPVGTLLTLTNTFPIWVTLLAWPVLGDRPAPAFIIAVISGVAGVALIEGPESATIRPATIAALLAAIGTAIVMIGLHRLRTLESLAIVVHFSGTATVVCLGFAVVTTQSWGIDLSPLRNPVTLLLLVGVGAFATLGQIGMTRAFAVGAPQNLSLVALSQVIFALGFDWLFWNRLLTLATFAGTFLILAPVAWLLARPPRP